MDLRQLEMFRMVAQTGGFTRASQKLYVSHSAICRQIKLLEDELGTLLFVRTHQNVSLTAAGQALLVHVEKIFEQVAEATLAVTEAAKTHTRRLNIGTATTMLYFFLPAVLPKFKQAYPSTSLLIKTGHTHLLQEEMRSGFLDVGIVTLPVDGRGLLVEPLYREEMLAVVGRQHPLASRRSVRPEELEKLPLISYPKGTSTRKVIDEALKGIGISPSISLEVDNEEAAETAIADGKGMAFVSKRRAAHDKFHLLRIPGCQIYREIALVSRVASPEHVTHFLNLCREQAKSQPEPAAAGL